MIDWKNVGERAFWTFIEAFLCALPATIKLDLDGAAWASILFSAACAGISAVKTLLIDIIKNQREHPPQ